MLVETPFLPPEQRRPRAEEAWFRRSIRRRIAAPGFRRSEPPSRRKCDGGTGGLSVHTPPIYNQR